MWGAVIGDIAGSRFEGSRGGPKSFEFFHQRCRYTDDTVCTAAVADIIVNDHRPDSTLQAWCRRHPDRGYGGHFRKWIASTAPTPYGSFGNGAAMRVGPAAFLYRGRSLEEALATSDRVTEITHDHPEGIKGARATEAIWLASQGDGPETLRREITTRYGDLGRSPEAIRPSHRFDVTCQGTVPTALSSNRQASRTRSATQCRSEETPTRSQRREALYGLPERLVRIARARYLDHAEDITAALDALYAHAMRAVSMET